MTTLLEIKGLTKAYPGVVANDDVGFTIERGTCHALLGENGAGKSTLVKMIYGLVAPDKGEMRFNGEVYKPKAPQEARASGVAKVFQHFSLFDALDVAENVALGMDNPPAPRDLVRRITEVSNEYGLPLDPNRLVGDLSAGEKQRVEIIRCLLQDHQLLIMDEPTSVLTPGEVEILFATLRKLTDEGSAILYISHKLDEIKALCQTATVLRHGKVVGECDPQTSSTREMAELMVGAGLSAPARTAKPHGKVRVRVDNLSVPREAGFGAPLNNVSFEVEAGEILGVGGVAGNGQETLLSALAGEWRTAPGTITVDDKDISALGPNARRELGVLSAPEERLGHAAAPDMSLTENGFLTAMQRKSLSKSGFINWTAARDFAAEVIEKFDVRTPGTHTVARALSGGNLQKFVMGREILQDPGVLIVNQPTWGVDAAAAATIRQALLDLADNGAAVIVISQDLDEVLEVSDRFVALNDGNLSQSRPTVGLGLDEIGLMLGGAVE